MARPRRTEADKDLDDVLAAWADWCSRNKAPPVNTASFQSRVMALKPGEVLFSGGGPVDPLGRDSVESGIEAALMRLFKVDEAAANVLRVEYQAGLSNLVSRQVIRRASARSVANMSQDDRARLLGMSLRTYRRRLKRARDAIRAALEEHVRGWQ